MILDHGRRPRHFGAPAQFTHKLDAFNPLCGDRETVYVKVEGDVLTDVGFRGAGCAISTASASMMTETLKGKTRAEAEAVFECFHDLITGREGEKGAGRPELGKLAVFSGVREFPVRVKCATLPWHTLKAALAGEETTVSTELTEGPKAESGGAS